MAGWVKLHRDITDNFLWSGEPFSRGQAWIDLILHANFTDNKIQIKGQVVDVLRGQQARSTKTLASDWGWQRSKVQRFLDVLKKQGMIVIKGDHLTSIITICNYDSFQDGESPDRSSNRSPDRSANDHLIGHSKEGKKEKNVKKEKKYSSDDLAAAEWIYKKLLTMNPNHKQPNMDGWANTVRLMREKDGRSHKEICEVFSWANADNFWSTNILSPNKLREKFDQLSIKANQPVAPNRGSVQAMPDRSALINRVSGADAISPELNLIEGDCYESE